MHYALIGAGPMGLCTARQLIKYGVSFTGFEAHSDVGGLWDIDNPHSTVYDSAHLISSKHMTEFTEFPMNEAVATYPHHSELNRYFKSYADQFSIRDFYEFSTCVISVEKENEQWRVITESAGKRQSRLFDGVLIANGTLHEPNNVALPGDYSGTLMHACDYKSPEVFKGKKVLVLGCGNSGADIAVDAVHHAASVDMSVRRGYYFLPKFIMGKATDTIGGKLKLPKRLKQWLDATLVRLILGRPSDYGLPDPDYRMYEAHPVINSLILHHLGHGDIHVKPSIENVNGRMVYFSDGSSVEYDLILQATGYKLHYPFIEAEHLNWKGMAPSLYLNVFSPADNNVFVMGMVEAAGLGWQGRDEQAEMVALYLHQKEAAAPSAKAMGEVISKKANERADGGFNYLPLERMAYYVHKDTYRQAVLSHIEALKQDMKIT